MISICVSLMNRGDNFKRLYETITRISDKELVVADYGSDDIDLSMYNCKVVELSLPFRRSAALNAAFDASSGDKVFFCDADMLLPAHLRTVMDEKVAPGQCYFPVCFSLYQGKPPVVNKDNGWWRSTGFGMCGFTREDFIRCGKWPEQFVKHGGEDDFLFAKAKKTLKVSRSNLEGLFHQWHDNDLQFKNRYY